MKATITLKSTLNCFLILGLLVGCNTGSHATKAMMVGQIQATSPDEKAIYRILENLKDYLSSSQWEKWLSLYSADAILTVDQKQVDKVEMRSIVNGTTYKITEIEILKKKIGVEKASVSVRMISNGKKHFETYKLKKFDGKWLIIEETNP